jgi:hypothetical protein
MSILHAIFHSPSPAVPLVFIAVVIGLAVMVNLLRDR